MTINSGDIKLKKTQVMLDVPEGGGPPTSVDVPDGVSNALFPDVSDSDRAGGRVQLRKVVAQVVTPNVADYLGVNVIVSDPPNDPNVAMTLYSTGDVFDRRVDAVARIEAYLSIGPQYPGYLFGNHVQGQSTLLIFQKAGDLPAIGATLVLTKREGFSNQFRQYVRVTEAVAVEREFEDDKGLFRRYVLTLKLSAPLSADFPGFDITRYEGTKSELANLTKVSDTVVADAARYYGVTPLEEEASIGSFTIKGESMFTQLVPSAQVETPILDARTNQLQAGMVPQGGSVRRVFQGKFNINQNLFIGGSVVPASLSLLVNANPPITDSNGRLIYVGAEVGNIDYDNGLLSLSSPIFDTADFTFDVSYIPGAAPSSVNQSQGFDITPENRSMNYVRTFEPAPLRGTMSVSYMAQGKWYVLRDQGDGALRGVSPAYGAGSINFTTGTVLVTLGALPDAGSALLFTWVEPDAARAANVLTLDNDGKLYWPFNTSGAVSLDAGAKAIEPGELVITWLDGVNARTATDNGLGVITGDASGSVNYARGTLRLSPNVLPPPGTQINVALHTSAKVAASVAIASGVGSLGATNVSPGSVSLTLSAQRRVQYLPSGGAAVNLGALESFLVRDNGAGGLLIKIGDFSVACGSVDYAAGTFSLASNVLLNPAQGLAATAWDNLFVRDPSRAWDMVIQAA